MLLLLQPKIRAGLIFIPRPARSGPFGRLPPSGSIPSCGPCPCAGPPGVQSPSYVGGDRRRQEVADVLEVLGVAPGSRPSRSTAARAGTTTEPREVATSGPGVRRQGPAGRTSKPRHEPLSRAPQGKKGKKHPASASRDDTEAHVRHGRGAVKLKARVRRGRGVRAAWARRTGGAGEACVRRGRGARASCGAGEVQGRSRE